MSLRVLVALLSLPLLGSVWPCSPGDEHAPLTRGSATSFLSPADFVDAAPPPSVAWSQGFYAAVWEDFDERLQGTLLLMRFHEDGQPLDPEPIPLATLGPTPAAPVVAATESSFFVVWQTASEGTYDILGALIPISDPVDLETLQVLPLAANPDLDEAEPTIAGSAKEFIVGWTVAPGTQDSHVVVQLVDSSGAPAAAPVPAPRADAQRSPSVAFGDSSAFVAWVEMGAQGEELRSALLAPGGDWIDVMPPAQQGLTPLDDDNPFLSPGNFSVSTTDGTEFWIAWETSYGAQPGVWLARVDAANAAIIDSNRLELEGSDPVLAYAKGISVLSWLKPDGALVYAELDSAGRLTNGGGDPISTPTSIAGRHALSGGGDAPFAVWRESDGDDVRLNAAKLTPGQALVSLLIHLFIGDASCPSLATDGKGYLMVWRQGPWLAPSIRAALLDGAGNRILPGDLRLGQVEALATCPSVAYSSGSYLTVWQSRAALWPVLRGRLVDAEGTLGATLTSGPHLASSSDLLPHVGRAPGGFLVATRHHTNPRSVLARYVSASNGSMGAAFLVGQSNKNVVDVKVSGGNPPIAAWATDLDVYAAPVTLPACPAQGCVVEHVASTANRVVALGASEGAFEGNRALIWEEASASGNSLVLATISDQGILRDLEQLLTGATQPSLAWNSQELVVAWTDPAAQIVRASRIDPKPSLVGLPVAGPAKSHLPSIASAFPGSTLLAYTKDGALGVSTVEVMSIAWSNLGLPCDEDSDCGGHCVDGVCCESECGRGNECMACSVARGSSADGKCEPVALGTPCTAEGACVVASACNGLGSCLPVELAPATTECRPAVGPCDLPEYCTGSSADCPDDGFALSGTECRASQGACDVAEVCDGQSPHCPEDAFAPPAESCQFDDVLCSVESQCTGTDATCPPPDGWPGCEPPGPSIPPLPPQGFPTLEESLSFLYSGPDPLQRDVTPNAISSERFAAVTGYVKDIYGLPLQGVRVSIHRRPEYGYTLTGADGSYHLALNGAPFIVVEFSKPGYLPVQRKLALNWQEWATLDDVTLIQYDPIATPITFGNQTLQVAQGSLASDSDGDRTATVFFPPGVTATVMLADGSQVPLHQATIRATEYTVGPRGPSAMPGELPPQIAYTYAVELSADEVVAMDGDSLVFSEPVYFYLENFLGFPVGEPVPMGYYDRKLAAWVPSDSGVVIKLLGVTGGLPEVDIRGDGVPAAEQELADLGFTPEELAELAQRYPIGQELWRVPVPHFSPWDCNWAWVLPADAEDPNVEPEPDFNEEDPCLEEGSVIECETQILRHRIPLMGTGLSLNYSSSRVPGWKPGRTVSMKITGAQVPSSLEKIEVHVSVAGRRFFYLYAPVPNLPWTFVWDGKDAFGREVNGTVEATITVAYIYGFNYTRTDRFGRRGTTERIFTEVSPRNGGRYQWLKTFTRRLTNVDARKVGLGGWTLDIHHQLDPTTGTRHYGDGSRRNSPAYLKRLALVSGSQPEDLTVGPDGVAYVISQGNIYAVNSATSKRVFNRQTAIVHRPSGQVTIGTRPVQALALAPDGRLFFGTDREIYWLNLEQEEAHWFGGTGASPCNQGIQNGVHVQQATFCGISSLAFGPDGTLYFTERYSGQNQVGAILPDGSIDTIYSDPRTSQFSPDAVVYGDDKLYVLSDYNGKVWRLDFDGTLTTFVEETTSGTPTSYMTEAFQDIAWHDGKLYLSKNILISYLGSSRVVGSVVGTITEDGDFKTLLGKRGEILTGAPPNTSEHGPIGAALAIAVTPSRELLAAEATSPIRITTTSIQASIANTTTPGQGPGGAQRFANETGTQIFQFADGLHLATNDAVSGQVEHEFSYDPQARLSAIIDKYGNTVEISHAGSHVVVRGPDGHESTLTLDPDGYLSKVEFPSGASYTLGYDPNGLLVEFSDPLGNKSEYTYNEQGRLTMSQNASGGGQSFSRSVVGQTLLVQSEKATGGSTSYELIMPPSGVKTRKWQVHGPDGETWSNEQSERDFGLVVQADYADGTSREVVLRPDPRWAEVRFPEKVTIQTPSGRGLVLTQSLTAEGPDIHVPGGTDLLTRSFSRGTSAPTTIVHNRIDNSLTVTSPLGRAISIEFDSFGAPISLQQGNLAPQILEYDSEGRLTASWRSLGGQQVRRVDFAYYDSQVLAPHMQGLLRSVSMPGSSSSAPVRSTSYQYDLNLNPSSITLSDGSTLGLGHDAVGNLTSVQPPSKPAHTMTFTPVHQLASYEPPSVQGLSNPSTAYTYDPDKKLEWVSLPDGLWIDPVYDANGFLDSIESPLRTISVDYWPGGRIKRLTASQGGNPVGTLDFHVDGPLPLGSTWTRPINGALRLDYDDQFRVSELRVLGGSSIGLTYDADSLLEEVTQGGTTLLSVRRDDQHNFDTALLTGTTSGVVTTEQRYNQLGERTSFEASTPNGSLWEVTYTYADDGRVLAQEEVLDGGSPVLTEYGYDVRGRLIEVRIDGTIVGSYAYDANGNRVSMNGSIAWTYDAQDRLLTAHLPGGTVTYAYSPSGSLASRTGPNGVTLYDYDVFGNLLGVTLPDGRQIEYDIDPANRRVGKRVDGQFVHGFLYDGASRIVAELGPTQLPAACSSTSQCGIGATCSGGICTLGGQAQTRNEVMSQFVYATRGHVPDLMIKNGVVYRILTDHLGSVRFVVDTSSGTVAQALQYDAWGNILVDTNPGFQPFGFAGGLYDPDTRLYRFGARDYDPEIGRWTAKDPIRFAGGDTNLYAYVLNDPVNFLDPNGLHTEVIFWEPAGYLFSSFGHVSITINGISYSWNPKGRMDINSADDYAAMQWFRSGRGLLLHLTPDQEDRLAGFLSDWEGPYHPVKNNCTDPIEEGLRQIGGFSLPNSLFPTGLAHALGSSAIGQTFYPPSSPPHLFRPPWSVGILRSFWGMH